MKKIFSVIVLLFCSLFTFSQVNSLQLQGIIDFDLVEKRPHNFHVLSCCFINSITNYIIQKHNGSLNIQSEVGKGTTVEICLPINPRHGE